MTFWNRIKTQVPLVEGVNLSDAAIIKAGVNIPVLVTGGFQTASVIRNAILQKKCDGVAIARPLIANPDLVKIFEQGKNRPDRPCSYCNKCLVNVLEHPIGCYDLNRYDGNHEKMIEEIFSVFDPKHSYSEK